MLYPGLTCIVTVISGLVLTGGSSDKEITDAEWVTISPLRAVRHQKNLDEGNNYFQNYGINENGAKWRRNKTSHRLTRDLNLVILKLKNVIGKYDQKSKELSVLYKGIANCGLNNCGKFPSMLPEKIDAKNFNCKKFKKRKGLKKRILGILSKGYTGCKTYSEQFQNLIRFEKSRFFRKQDKSNGSRLTILRDLQNEIKALNVGILEVKIVEKNKRLNSSDEPRKAASTFPKFPESTTDLKIREWSTLQQSKEYLKFFQESLEEVLKCWKKRERK